MRLPIGFRLSAHLPIPVLLSLNQIDWPFDDAGE